MPPEPLSSGLPPTDPRSLCPLSSTEFVDPPPEQNSWVHHCSTLHHSMDVRSHCHDPITFYLTRGMHNQVPTNSF